MPDQPRAQARRDSPQGYPSAPSRVSDTWYEYLVGGYFDPSGNIFPELLQSRNVKALAKQMANADPKLTTGQIRRFFQHCRAIEARIKLKQATWESQRQAFLMLGVAAADAHGKSPRPKIPHLFYDFITRNVEATKTEKDFLYGFLPHFEALVGYGAAYFKERN